jgi:hypothetical protein
MKIKYALFQGSRCVGVDLYASSMKEINATLEDLNSGELKFRVFISDIRQGV